MTRDILRIAMWSGPRNISTAMMRAFGNRADTQVIDEPFYAAWLARSGADHPMREAVLAAQPTDPARVAAILLGPVPAGKSVFYQKHMAHHMTPDMDPGWMASCRHAFLIRPPHEVLASYTKRRQSVTLAEIGIVQQVELFDRVAQAHGHAPPVLAADDVLANPEAALTRLCAALGLGFDPAMLTWPAGPRETDGVWAPVWYDAVAASTGFARPGPPIDKNSLTQDLRALADQAQPYYARLAAHRI